MCFLLCVLWNGYCHFVKMSFSWQKKNTDSHKIFGSHSNRIMILWNYRINSMNCLNIWAIYSQRLWPKHTHTLSHNSLKWKQTDVMLMSSIRNLPNYPTHHRIILFFSSHFTWFNDNNQFNFIPALVGNNTEVKSKHTKTNKQKH